MSAAPDSDYSYQLGGSLELNHPSYVFRQADRDFYEELRRGEFCYVLNSRQTGKSSLRVQIMNRLQAEGITCAEIDLTGIGGYQTSPEQWYGGIIHELISSLELEVDRRTWWLAHADLSPVQRFKEFIEKVLLESINENIVIFIDEIDSMLHLDFKDDFFALIRACYDKRANQTDYQRLTFVLLGVASPADLMSSQHLLSASKTPFNVGRLIELNGFKFYEVEPLSKGLTQKASYPKAVLHEILLWTGGQPFLTQKLCKLIYEVEPFIPAGTEAHRVEMLVRSRIIENWQSQDTPEHLKTIRDRLMQSSHQRTKQLLHLYQQILHQGAVVADCSPEQIELRLSGLVVKQEEQLKVCNRIYRMVFNESWVEGALSQLERLAQNATLNEPQHTELPSELFQLGPNPYQGLLAFQETDGDRFFGRDRQIEQLWQKFSYLHKGESTIRVLPIYGPSGSGKSSLARAGFISRVIRRLLPGLEKARVVVMVPGIHPLNALAKALARVATNDSIPVEKSQEFERVLKKQSVTDDFEGLRHIADVLSDIALSPLLVLVDQFEEIYTLCEDKQERDAFVRNLLHAAADSSQRVSVILTLRSDFLGETQKHPELNELFAEQGFLVRSMTQEELRQAIAEPAKHSGYDFNNAMIDLLIKDTEGREGALPLLQFALTRIWEGLCKDQEPATTLKAIGGVGGALAGEAQRIFDDLNPTEQDIARRVFLGLVQLGEGTKDTRRRVEMQQVISHRDDPEQVKQVIARFSGAEARLIALSATADGSFETAEVTHETLLEQWQQLQNWLDNSRSDLQFQRRLDEAAQYWEEHGRAEGSLWRSPDLDLLRRYRERSGDEITPRQMAFFEASTTAAELQQRKERQQRQFQRMAIRGLAILSTSAISLSGFALYQLQQLQRQRVEQLATTSKALLLSQTGNAAINAIAAVGLGESAFVRFPNSSFSASAHASLLEVVQMNREQNLLQHGGAVHSVTFSSDGQRIVSGSEDKTVRLWNATTGEPIGQPLRGYEDAVYSVASSPDGQRIVSGNVDGTMRLWDAITGKPIGQPLRGHESVVWSVAFSSDGKRIASGSHDKTVRLWNATTGEPIGQPLKGNEIRSVAFSPDGKRIVSGSDDKTLRLWNATTGEPIGQPFRGHEDTLRSVAFSPDGKRIVSSSVDKTVRLWDATTGRPMGEPLRGHEDAVRSVAFSPDGKRIVSGSDDKTVRLWDVTTGKPIGEPLRGHENAIWSVAFSPDGKRIVSGSDDKTVRLWDVTTEKFVGQPFRGHEDSIASVTFSPDGKRIVSGSNDKTVRLWDVTTGKPIGQPLKGHESMVLSVAFSPNGKRIVSGSGDKTVRLWDVTTGKPIGQPLKGHESVIRSVAFSPDGKRIVSGSDDKTVRLWDVTTGKPIGQPLKRHENWVWSVAFSPDGKRIVSGSNDKTVRLWDVTTGKPIGQPLKGHESMVLSVAFSPNGKRIVSGSGDKTVRLWDVTTGKPIGQPLKGHESVVTSVAFSPDSKHIVSGSYDKMVRLWDAATGQTVGQSFRGHESTIYSVAFSPDGQRIVSSSQDKTVRLWSVNWAINWKSPLKNVCELMRYHSHLVEPTTEVAKEAARTCKQSGMVQQGKRILRPIQIQEFVK